MIFDSNISLGDIIAVVMILSAIIYQFYGIKYAQGIMLKHVKDHPEEMKKMNFKIEHGLTKVNDKIEYAKSEILNHELRIIELEKKK